MATDKFLGLDEPVETGVGKSGEEPIIEGTQPVETSHPDNIYRTPTDPNKISVHITDDRSPIILLFGAPSSGKTMTLVRLGKYLKKQGYTLTPDSNFCTDAWEYEENAINFKTMLGTTEALPGTDSNDFMLLKVRDSQGKVLCQILEGAGEDYFSMNDTVDRETKSFPPYMNGVFASNNKKIWMFITEPNWHVKLQDKQSYVGRIGYCKRQHLGPKDKCIILYNKVDTTDFVVGSGKVNIKNAMTECHDEYEGLFDLFKTKRILLGDKYDFKFVPFSTGLYSGDETVHYTPSNDNYPRMLWSTIQDCIKGL